MIAAFVISLLFHACVFTWASLPCRESDDLIMPELQAGESALNLTFVSIPSQAKKPEPEPKQEPRPEPVTEQPPEPEPIIVPEPEPPEKQVEETLSEPEENEPEPEQEARPDADLLTKGVRESVFTASEIRPYYPLGSRVRGEEGVVTLEAKVVPPGLATEVAVVESSGYQALDMAAVKAAKRARFTAAGGRELGAESSVKLTFRFQLID